MTIVGTPSGFNEWDGDSLGSISDKIYQNYLAPNLELFDAKVTINHWQLRDCIKPYSGSSNGELYYIYDHSIRSLNTDSRCLSSEQQYYDDDNDDAIDVDVDDVDNDDGSNQKTKNKRQRISKYTLADSNINKNNNSNLYGSPTQTVVDFNFKPRCFTEQNGLIACGGLVGSDDKGFPTNWNRVDHDDSQATSSGSSLSTSLQSPALPISMSSRNILSDGSNYGNPNIWKGILSIYNHESKFKTSVILGQFINNCVTVHGRSTQSYNLYTCNNDGHIYQCDISNRSVELVRRYSDLSFPLNNASLSHDGKTMIVSGDSNKFAIYKQNEVINQFTLKYDNQPEWGSSKPSRVGITPRFDTNDITATIDNNVFETTNGDHGFYNCFSENDLQFATLFQNGICLMYDIRNTSNPLAEIISTRPQSHNGAFRVCRFSYGLDDLLFISEHQGRVHVVDTRNFTNHQVIFLPNKINVESDDVNSARSSSHSLNTLANGMRSYYPGSRGARTRILTSGLTDNLSGKFGEPWTTSACKLPSKYLEPYILPFPKAVNKHSNHFFNHGQHYNRQTGSVSSIDLISGDSDSNNENNELQQYSREADYDMKETFKVRRISTASGQCGNKFIQDANNDSDIKIDSSNLSRGSGHHSNMLRLNVDDTLFDNEGGRNAFYLNPDNSSDDSSALETYHSSLNRSLIDPIIERTGDSCLSEENNISGITWLNDRDGNSLIIGTDYGIVKWNINSSARRSFASYDFC
ncbi:similar to Saccharomyces cerevisiae YLR149C Putative protein of unknown function [Maudiozyma barnettii]|uniref:DUF2415 domain-containing protein n=1 Tax=Maudiozyma barnettii TaxID=61262 RepID=A0A8H2VGH8_9SACH|nr:Gid11p [Kazachstania barnettii]CAB4254803.1 similar to Saccharomyces cerevisiae YLR149C Putative protein of unknown function [Kazachstania barnettii]CAD1782967.1 similar to Saccharomyces cerevisiae YLR149C Putative protein of unknown function [Kazachstania barnettii]